MLIIFDLDDTLVDTSGCITPFKLEDALYRMVEAGLALPSIPDAIEMIKRLDDSSESARQTLAEFLEINDGDRRFLEIGVKEVYENISPEIPILPLRYACETLLELRASHQLALVTLGREDQQLRKLEKAGIDSTIFSKIVVCREGSKKPHYEAISKEFGCFPSDVVVCGDRISVDLAPAKELGFRTIHMRWGRGVHASGSKSDVDYAISQFSEIREILAALMSFSFLNR